MFIEMFIINEKIYKSWACVVTDSKLGFGFAKRRNRAVGVRIPPGSLTQKQTA